MIDRHAGVTAYDQVKSDIQFKIKHDVYKVGDQLPTNQQFCEIYDVSRITINRALSELENEGYIERFQGKGCFVKFKEINQNMSRFYSFTEELKKMGYKPSSKLVSWSIVDANDELCEKLEIAPSEKVVLLERLRFADDVVMAYDRSYIPCVLVPNFDVSMIRDGSLYNTLESHYGFRPNHSEETIEAINIDDHDAEYMGVEKNSPVLLIKRVSYCNDKKVEFNYRIVNSKMFKYKMYLE